jgi:hypothetical protein
LLTGTGAGSSTAALGNAWPVVKLINEYGLVSTVLFVALYLMAFARSYNVPLAMAISLMFHFTGGYLLDGVIVQLMAVIFCMVVPLGRVETGNFTQSAVIAAAERTSIPPNVQQRLRRSRRPSLGYRPVP